jgi:hypothetical protein
MDYLFVALKTNKIFLYLKKHRLLSVFFFKFVIKNLSNRLKTKLTNEKKKKNQNTISHIILYCFN